MSNKLDSIKLDHNSYISLHVQIHNQLRQLIISKRWKNGERIPTEAQLSRHLDISRTTVRIALQRAELEGLIKRTAGRGTFVTYESPENTSSRLIGYVTRSFDNEIHRIHLNIVETELRSAGYRVIFSNAVTSDEEVSILEQLLEDNIEGVLIYPHAESTQAQKDILNHYKAQNIPVVFMDRDVDGVDFDFVTSDNFDGGYSVVKHLIELGHQHITFLQPNIDKLITIDERYEGYCKALEEHGLPIYDRWRISSSDGYEFFEADIFTAALQEKSILVEDVIQCINQADPRPSAIFCCNDSLALITLLAVQKQGLKVPDDISIAGFDDISLASYMSVPLTTVAQNAYELGKVAAQRMVERLDGKQSPATRYTIPTRLQVRMSTSTPAVKVAND